METQIYKLNSATDSIDSLLTTISSKFKAAKKGYDITLIVRESEEETKMSSTALQPPEEPIVSKKISVNFAEDALVFGSDLSEPLESEVSLEDNFGSAPNIPSTKRDDSGGLRNILTKMRLKANRSCKENAPMESQQYGRGLTSVDDRTPATPPHAELSLKIGSEVMDDSLAPPGATVVEVESELSSSKVSGEEGDSEAGFLIENHLGQAVEMVELGELDRLEDFLYDFKEKYSFMNERVEVKWSLLMGHCKENKMEYERAANNYTTVANALDSNPHLMPGADLGEVHAHLGICYFEMRQWNRGIAALTKALNLFRQQKKYSDYAGCLINLGQLYLQTGYYSEAERCLLTAHSLKRGEGADKKAKTNILPILLLLADCNLRLRNYRQAGSVLEDISAIIEEAEYIDVVLLVGMHIRKAALALSTGKLGAAEENCQQALRLLGRHQVECREYAEVYEMLGTIRLEEGALDRSKNYFEKAYKAVVKYEATDSPKITVLRHRIQQLQEVLQPSTARSKNKQPVSLRSQPI